MVIDSSILNLQNPWWQNRDAIKEDQHLLEIEGKSYKYTPQIIDQIAFKGGDIHVIRGPRQVGKTTTLKLIIKKLLSSGQSPSQVIYLSCESFLSFYELQPVLIECLKGKLSLHSFLFLDEISFVEEWQRAILSVANMGMLRNTTVIITGSNARDLKESSERLPGRRGMGKDYKLYPLSVVELSKLDCFKDKNINEILDIYMLIGGFPRAISDFVTLGSISDATYETYRNWIIGDAQRYELRQETLKQILFRIAETIASRITWPVLIENSPVRSHETALQYVEHLQDAFLCVIHYCYDNKTKSPSFQKARKLFFIDPLIYTISATWKEGIPNIFNWMKQRLKESDFKGKLLESVIVNHLSRMYDNIYFWYSTKQKREVDILISNQNQLMLYDVKLQPDHFFKVLGKDVKILYPEEFLNFISHKHL